MTVPLESLDLVSDEPLYYFQTIKGFSISLVALLVFWIVCRILEKRNKRFGRRIIKPIKRPLCFGIGGALLTGLLLEKIELIAESSLSSTLIDEVDTNIIPEGDIAGAILEIGICWAIINLLKSLLQNSKLLFSLFSVDDEKEQATLLSFFDKVFTCLAILITAIILMSTFGIPASSLAALIGGAGIGIGFGTQRISQNFFAGIMLFFTRPFSEGDWINLQRLKIEGTVEEIGWYQTRIRTFSRRPLYIPNSVFSTTEIENPGRMYNRRIKCLISLRYEDISIIDTITKKVRQLLVSHPDIDQKHIILVHFKEWDSSSVNMQVYCFTKTVLWEEWLDIQQNIFLQIADLIKQEGGDFAKPAITLYPSKKIETIANNFTQSENQAVSQTEEN